VIQESLVVDLQEPLERVGTLAAPGGSHGAPDQQARALADHATDLLLGQRLTAELFDQLIGGLGKIAPRIDEGAVEIEGNQAV